MCHLPLHPSAQGHLKCPLFKETFPPTRRSRPRSQLPSRTARPNLLQLPSPCPSRKVQTRVTCATLFLRLPVCPFPGPFSKHLGGTAKCQTRLPGIGEYKQVTRFLSAQAPGLGVGGPGIHPGLGGQQRGLKFPARLQKPSSHSRSSGDLRRLPYLAVSAQKEPLTLSLKGRSPEGRAQEGLCPGPTGLASDPLQVALVALGRPEQSPIDW